MVLISLWGPNTLPALRLLPPHLPVSSHRRPCPGWSCGLHIPPNPCSPFRQLQKPALPTISRSNPLWHSSQAPAGPRPSPLSMHHSCSPTPAGDYLRVSNWTQVGSEHPSNACVCMRSCVRLFATPQTVAHQATLTMGFSRQEYWNGLPCPPPGDLPNPGIELTSLMSPALAGGFFTRIGACQFYPIFESVIPSLSPP